MVCGRLQHTFVQTSFYFTTCFFFKRNSTSNSIYNTAVLINNMRRQHCSNKRIKEVKKKINNYRYLMRAILYGVFLFKLKQILGTEQNPVGKFFCNFNQISCLSKVNTLYIFKTNQNNHISFKKL